MDLSDREIEARELAVKEVAKLLASSESLQNIRKLSEEYALKKAALENNLSTLSHSRVEDARTALSLLHSAASLYGRFRTDFSQIDSYASQSRASIPDEQVIFLFERAQNAKTNLRSCIDTAAKLVHLPTEIERIKSQFSDEEALLDTYRRIRELEAVRDSFSGTVADHYKKKHFLELLEQVDQLVDEFYNTVLRNVMAECVKYAQTDAHILCKVVRILVDHPPPTKRNEEGTTESKSLMWCFEVWQAWAKWQVMECEGDLDKLIDFCRDTLHSFLQYVELCFPREWRVLDKFISILHGRVTAVVEECKGQFMGDTGESLSGIQSNASLMDLVGFLRAYHSELQATEEEVLNIAEAEGDNARLESFMVPDIQPQIDELLDHFLSKIGGKLHEWTQNLIAQENNDEKTLEQRDEDGCIVSTLPSFVFRMLHQQMGIARESEDAEIEMKVCITCVECLQDVAASLSSIISERSATYYSFDHLCAFCNNNLLINDYANEFCERYATALESYGEDSGWEAAYDAIIFSFAPVKDAAERRLADQIFTDIAPVLNACAIHWADSEQKAESVFATLDDYMNDVSGILLPKFSRELSQSVLSRLCFQYAHSMLSKKPDEKKEKNQLSFDIIDAHTKRMRSIFQDHMKSDDLERLVGQVERLADFLDATDEDEIIFVFRELVNRYPDASWIIAEKAILSLKGETFDKKVRNECIDMCKDYYNKLSSQPDFQQRMEREPPSAFGQWLAFQAGEYVPEGMPGFEASKAKDKGKDKKQDKGKTKGDSKDSKSDAAQASSGSAASNGARKPSTGGKRKDEETGVEVLSLSDLLKQG